MPALSRRPLSSMAATVLAVGVCILGAPPVHAQLGTRPAADWIPTLESSARLAAMRLPALIEALEITPGSVVADVGAGSGVATPSLAEAAGNTGRVIASDIDPGLIAHIDRRMRDAHVTNVRTVLGTPSDPRLPEPVDLAFMNDVLHHVADRAAYLKQLATQIKPGGRLAIVDYTETGSPHRGQPALIVTETQVDAWATSAGLVRTRAVPLYDDRYVVIYTRR